MGVRDKDVEKLKRNKCEVSYSFILVQVRQLVWKDGNIELKGLKLGIESLHKHFIETDVEGMVYNFSTANNIFSMPAGAHRALPDVMAMERVFTHLSLVACLSNLPIRSPKQQKSLWMNQKSCFRRRTALTRSLGKPSITPAQANRLDTLSFTHGDLLRP